MSTSDIIFRLLSLAGSLALFLFGIKIMSHALQRVTAKGLIKLLKKNISNPFKGILAGLTISAVIQSSSVTTVMVASFVNAGMLELSGAIALIMGANIGTTLTGWIVSVLGLKYNLYLISLPLLGLVLPLLFFRRQALRNLGEFFIGFFLLFIGLHYLQSTISSQQGNAELISFLSGISDYGYFSALLFLAFGIIISGLLQSSSTSMALTLVLCGSGIIPFSMGAAMILGENIGTSISANYATLLANRQGKRAALTHLLFNSIGIIWMLPAFPLVLRGIDFLMITFLDVSPFADNSQTPIALAIFHSGFNVLNTLLLLGFIPQLTRLTTYLIPIRKTENKREHLQIFEQSFLSTPELDILQARQELLQMAGKLLEMIKKIPRLITEMKSEKQLRLIRTIYKSEGKLSKYDEEIRDFLTNLAEKNLSTQASDQLSLYLKVSDELLGLGELLGKITREIEEKNTKKIWFTQGLRNTINKMFEQLQDSYTICIKTLSSQEPEDLLLFKDSLHKIQASLEENTILHFEQTDKNEYTHKAGLAYVKVLKLLQKTNTQLMLIAESFDDFQNKSLPA